MIAMTSKTWEVGFDLLDREGWPFDCAARGVKAGSLEAVPAAVREIPAVARLIAEGCSVEVKSARRESRAYALRVVIP